MPLEKQVWDVIDSRYQMVTPETPLKEACAILSGTNREHPGDLGLVIRRASGEYLGLLTARDILRYLLYLRNQSLREGQGQDWLNDLLHQCRDGSIITVNDVLVHYDLAVRPNQNLLEVLQIMDSENVDIIPVVDAGKIIGVVRSQDVLSEFARLVR